MNINKFENVLKLEPLKRYQYFIKKVADFEELWTVVYPDGTYGLTDIEQKTLISFWSEKDFIFSTLINEWSECIPKRITLDDFSDEFIDLIESENYLLNVFPIHNKSGFVVNLEEFIRDLNEELKNY